MNDPALGAVAPLPDPATTVLGDVIDSLTPDDVADASTGNLVTRVIVIEARGDGRAAALLSAEGLVVETAYDDFDAAEKLVATFDPHVVLIETLTLRPEIVRLCEVLDSITRAAMILFYDHGEEPEVVAAFAAGARAVVREPVGSHELVARVRALLRRARSGSKITSETVLVGPVSLDRPRHVLSIGDVEVPMPPKEFDIAECLMRKAGMVVSREELLRELWGSRRDAKSMAVQVGRLRARLAAVEGRARIVTVRGIGYRFATDEQLARGRRSDGADEPNAGDPIAP